MEEEGRTWVIRPGRQGWGGTKEMDTKPQGQGEEDSVPCVPGQQDDDGEQTFAAHLVLKVRGKVTHPIWSSHT